MRGDSRGLLSAVVLRAGRDSLVAERAIVERARVRAIVEPFVTAEPGRKQWTLSAGQAEGAVPLVEGGVELGALSVDGTRLTVALGSHEHAGLAALRAAYFASVLDQGGLLLHACAVSFGGGVACAAGVSGAGKSTLARLAGEAGATLLSDEIVALLPDGTAWGTPFFSDYRAPGAVGGQPLRLALALVKASAEALVPLKPQELARLFLSQAFRTEALPLSNADALARLSRCLERAEACSFHFRKDVEAGAFLCRALSERAR